MPPSDEHRRTSRAIVNPSRLGIDDGWLSGPAAAWSSGAASVARSDSETSDAGPDFDDAGEAILPEGLAPGDFCLASGFCGGEKRRFKAVLLEPRRVSPAILVKYVGDEHGTISVRAAQAPLAAYGDFTRLDRAEHVQCLVTVDGVQRVRALRVLRRRVDGGDFDARSDAHSTVQYVRSTSAGARHGPDAEYKIPVLFDARSDSSSAAAA